MVPVTSTHKDAAVAFTKWLNSDPDGTKALSDNGLFPATTDMLKDPAFLDKPIEVLGGQKANQVFAQSSAAVSPNWQFLPYQVYANSVFKDTVGQGIAGNGSISSGMEAWQKRITDFGTQQGFSITAP